MKWYETSHFRCLVDMHIPDFPGALEKFDPEVYAENMLTAGVDTAYVYASNCLGLCLYPSKIGYLHPEAKKRDIFGETVAAIRRKGIGVVGYLNNWSSAAAAHHPEWQIVDENGIAMRDTERFGTCCPNSPYREYFLSLVKEMVSSYDIDGLWVDMVGFWMPVCCCSACREKYRALTGEALPTVMDYHDPKFIRYLNFKNSTLTEYAADIVSTAKAARPGITVIIQSAAWSNAPFNGMNRDFFSQGDFVAGDFYDGKSGTDMVCRLLPQLSKNAPFEYMTSRATDLSWHTSSKSVEEMTLQAMNALMSGGSFVFIDAIDPDGTMNRELYRNMRTVRSRMEPFLPYVDYNLHPIRDVGVYMNFSSFSVPGQDGKPVAEMPARDDPNRLPVRLKRISDALLREHLDYDILTEGNLDILSRYKVIILPNLARMSQKETDAIREYVRRGGKIYVSGQTSLLHADGTDTGNFMLSDVLGVDYRECEDRKPMYAGAAPGNEEFFLPYTPKRPHMLPRPMVTVQAHPGTKVLATVTRPVSDSRDARLYHSAISDPPFAYTDVPAITETTFGAGESVYSAGDFESDGMIDNQKLFVKLVQRLLGTSTVETDAPECVEVTLRHDPEKRRVTLSLLNYQPYEMPIPVQNLRVCVRIPMGEGSVTAKSVSGETVKIWKTADGFEVTISGLELFDMVIVESK